MNNKAVAYFSVLLATSFFSKLYFCRVLSKSFAVLSTVYFRVSSWKRKQKKKTKFYNEFCLSSLKQQKFIVWLLSKIVFHPNILPSSLLSAFLLHKINSLIFPLSTTLNVTFWDKTYTDSVCTSSGWGIEKLNLRLKN